MREMTWYILVVELILIPGHFFYDAHLCKAAMHRDRTHPLA